MNNINNIEFLWNQIYDKNSSAIRNDFIQELKSFKAIKSPTTLEAEWYKDVTVYSLYVDLFNANFKGLEDKLGYLKNLGVSCLWLLPILDSPGRDAGFDIKDYRKIRPELLNFMGQETFDIFLEKAHNLGIKVIFDIAINHTSEEHFWFQESRKSPENPYRDYYIWNKNDDKYADARLIFYGIEQSNWRKDGDEYFFHRFFDFQPDLNYRNPKVLVEMCRNFLYWLSKGVDGFRADAIPYLWKEEGTDCENLDMTHTIVKFFRAVIDFVRPNALLLAEACQRPSEVVKYFGNGNECHAGYHFPLMPQIFKALAAKDSASIVDVLSRKITPEIPESCQWFTFLRCHDELSLELVYVSESDRKYIHESYCKKPEWDFRLGQGISSRLSELMDKDYRKIGLIYSIMLTLPGTPVVYYGDEFGKLNDRNYYDEQIKHTGKDDTRFLVRGRIDWQKLDIDLKNKDSFAFKVYMQLSNMLQIRSKYKAFGRGKIEWISLKNIAGDEMKTILIYKRIYKNEQFLLIHNLSNQPQELNLNNLIGDSSVCLLGELKFIKNEHKIIANPFEYYWIVL